VVPLGSSKRSCALDGLQLWDARAPSLSAIHVWEHSREQPCQALSWSNCHRTRFASAGDDGFCRVWDVSTDRSLNELGAPRVQKLDAKGFGLWDCQFHPRSGEVVAACGVQGALSVWDVRMRGDAVAMAFEACAETLGVDWSKYDEHALATACADHSVKVFDSRKPGTEAVSTLVGHSLALLSLQWSPWNGNELLSTSYDLHTALWNTRSFLGSALQRRWSHHSEFIQACSWSCLQRDVVASVGWDRRVVVHSVGL
jgi:peroxin-7